jgi:hypothetical protein
VGAEAAGDIGLVSISVTGFLALRNHGDRMDATTFRRKSDSHVKPPAKRGSCVDGRGLMRRSKCDLPLVTRQEICQHQ